MTSEEDERTMLQRRLHESLDAAQNAVDPDMAERHRGFARLYLQALDRIETMGDDLPAEAIIVDAPAI